MEKATCILQARMGSRRLPGKSMAPVAGVPVIEVVMRRLAKSRRLAKVVLATSDLDHDTVLAETAECAGFPVFRGSENDLVGRFVGAADAHADGPHIVRATGDNVYMDWDEIDRLVDFGIAGGWDFVGFENPVHPDRMNDFAGEFIRLDALREVARLTDDPNDREHVFPYFYTHPEAFRVTRLRVDPSLHTPVKLDLDYPEDLEIIQAVGREIEDPIGTPARRIAEIASTLKGLHKA